MKQINRGFTLIELMITLAIIGILATISIPSLIDFFNSQKEIAAAQQVINTLNQARHYAISSRSNVSIVVSNSNKTFTILDKDNNIINQLTIKSNFLSSNIGVKNGNPVTTISFTSVGVPYKDGSALDTDNLIFAYSMTQQNTLNTKNLKTIGVLLDGTGLAKICKNSSTNNETSICNQ